MHDFFISYSSKDERVVSDYVHAIERYNLKCWYAPKDCIGTFAKSIFEAIDNSKVFLLFLSRASANAEYVLNEVSAAIDIHKNDFRKAFLAPVFIEDFDFFSFDYREMRFFVGRRSILPFYKEESIDKNVQLLLRNIAKLLNRPDLLDFAPDRKQFLYVSRDFEKGRTLIQSKMWNRIAIPVYEKILSNYETPRILDLGCSNGTAIMSVLNTVHKQHRLVGISKSPANIEKARQIYGDQDHLFYEMSMEDDNFLNRLSQVMNNAGIAKFDVINISMVIQYIRSPESLFQNLHSVLDDDGIIIVRDVDDGMNLAYPDKKSLFMNAIEINSKISISGDRHSGRRIYTIAKSSGYNHIQLCHCGLSSIGMNAEEKEELFDLYFTSLLNDLNYLVHSNTASIDIINDHKFITENYNEMRSSFLQDDFMFLLGYLLYTIKAER